MPRMKITWVNGGTVDDKFGYSFDDDGKAVLGCIAVLALDGVGDRKMHFLLGAVMIPVDDGVDHRLPDRHTDLHEVVIIKAGTE